MAPVLRFMLLVGVACIGSGVMFGVPMLWIAGLLIAFVMVPLAYVREKTRFWIQDRLKPKDKQ